MEPESSLSRSQKPATDPYPEPHESNSDSSNNISVRNILILSSHVHLALPSCLFLWDFRTKMYALLISNIRTTCLAHLILRASIILIISGEEYNQSRSFSLCNFLHLPFTLSLLVPNIFLITLFWNILNQCSCLNVRHQVSHPYKE
jgi:hypothetical protein